MKDACNAAVHRISAMRISQNVWLVAASALALTVGALVYTGTWVPVEAFDRRPQVVLTGKDKAGWIEVPVINLWERPGFGGDNRVAARIHLPAEGQIDARLINEFELAGLTWREVAVRGSRGWVVSRFVAE